MTLTNIGLVILMIVFDIKMMSFLLFFRMKSMNVHKLLRLYHRWPIILIQFHRQQQGKMVLKEKRHQHQLKWVGFPFLIRKIHYLSVTTSGIHFPRKTKSAIMKMPTMILLLSCLTKTNNIIIK